jgi:hypothetical protein
MPINYLNLADIDRQVSDNQMAGLQRETLLSNLMRQKKADAEDEAYRGAFKGALDPSGNLNTESLVQKLIQANQGPKAWEVKSSLAKQALEQQKESRLAESAQFDAMAKKAEYSRNAFATVAPDGSNWSQIRQHLIDVGATDAKHLPEQYDPNVHKNLMFTADAFLKQNAPKDVDYNKPFLSDGTPNVAYQKYEQSKPSGINIYGSPQAGVDANGNPVFFQAGKDGTSPKIIEGVRPTPKDSGVVEAEDTIDNGLPKPQVPWSATTDAKARDRFKQKEYEVSRKKLDTFEEEANKAKNLATRAERFLELNNKIATGGLADKIPGGQFAQSFGNDYAEMQSISADLVPEMREKGSGATSDFDAKMFQRATVGVDKPGGANKNIVTAIKAKAQLLSDKQDFLNAYLEQNGTLTGADSHWKKYVEANPIFDKTKEKSLGLNAKRESWSDYFAKQKPTAKQKTQVLPPVNAQGWTLHVDGKGNKAYVSPDGKQFSEVK